MAKPTSYSIEQIKIHPAEIFGRVEFGREELFITKRRKIIAKLVPVDPEPLVEDPLAKIARGKNA